MVRFFLNTAFQYGSVGDKFQRFLYQSLVPPRKGIKPKYNLQRLGRKHVYAVPLVYVDALVRPNLRPFVVVMMGGVIKNPVKKGKRSRGDSLDNEKNSLDPSKRGKKSEKSREDEKSKRSGGKNADYGVSRGIDFKGVTFVVNFDMAGF